MRHFVGFILMFSCVTAFAQVDTSFIYNPSTQFGMLDIRIAEAHNRYWYLQEGVTFSFRESAPGVKTNTFRDLTSWDSSPYTEGNLRKRSGTNDAFVMNYRLLYPLNYNAEYSPGYPIIVMLHGAGERGNCWDFNCYWSDRNWRPHTNTPAANTHVQHQLLNNDHNLTHGGVPHLEARNLAGSKLPDDPTLDPRAFPGFVVFPQNLNGWEAPSSSDVIRMVRLMIKKYNIDPNRVYLHGLSNGGQGCYDVVKRAPWLFAAVLPMSAINETSIISKGLTPTIAHIPLWTFQGGQDTNPSPSKTFGYVKVFRDAGMSARYSYYPSLGHGTWNTAYAEPDFFSWILEKRKSNFHVFFDSPKICSTTGTGAKFGFAAGFFAYQWEKDGQIINGATSHEYVANEPGVYRGRFSRVPNPSEADWNSWSQPVTVTINSPEKAVIDVEGTRFMRGPDDNTRYNTVAMKARVPNDKHYWYKNGALVNIPNTSLDDTTRTYQITAAGSIHNGKFTLVTQSFDNCPTPPSDTTYLYFANSGPWLPGGSEPSEFTGVPLSPSSVVLNWQNNASGEPGFEIWRRKTDDFFRLAGIAAPGTSEFVDTNLEPSVTYEYKIRAIGDQNRSHYFPGNALDANLVVTTGYDTIPPAAPANVLVTGNTVSTISITWAPATDNIRVLRYHITYGDTSVTTADATTSFTLTGLPMNVAYSITVMAEDYGGNISEPSEPATGHTYVTGLTYHHSTGGWTDLDDIDWSNPEFKGTVPNFTLDPRTQEDYFFMEFFGYLYISQGGTYQFALLTDDGSRLTLNDSVIVDHDGLHGYSRKDSDLLELQSGPQTINVKYFDHTGNQFCRVQYKGPDTNGNWIYIPSTALRSGSAAPAVSATSLQPALTVVPEHPAAGQLSVRAYPNPASPENFFIQVSSPSEEAVEVRLVDLMGKSFFHRTLSYEEARAGARVSVEVETRNGMYIIIVNQGKFTSKEKVIIRN